MTVPIIALVLGLLFFFLGLALLRQEKKDKKAKQRQADEESIAAVEESGDMTTDAEQPDLSVADNDDSLIAPADNASGVHDEAADSADADCVARNLINPRRVKLGLMMAGQGLLLAGMGLALLIVHNNVVKIPWYISLPVAVVYLIVCFVVDCLKMAPPEPTADDAAEDSAQAGITPVSGDASDIDTTTVNDNSADDDEGEKQ